MRILEKDVKYVINKGDHFKFLLPDGTVLNFEQTTDDFSITKNVKGEELVCYTQATSESAKKSDEDVEFVSGHG